LELLVLRAVVMELVLLYHLALVDPEQPVKVIPEAEIQVLLHMGLAVVVVQEQLELLEQQRHRVLGVSGQTQL
jgi:hypothetical protein